MRDQPEYADISRFKNEAEKLASKTQGRFLEKSYLPVNPALLQPAEPFVALSGEDMRRRLCLIAQNDGVESAQLCLRPDFTIPVAQHFLRTGCRDFRLCYAGTSFRRTVEHPLDQVQELVQAGVELYGEDKIEADIEIIVSCLDAVLAEGLNRLELRVGHPGLFSTFLRDLTVSEHWQRRLRRHFNRHDLSDELQRARAERADHPATTLAETLSRLDENGAAHMIMELAERSGASFRDGPVGGRSTQDIAVRLMERVDDNHRMPSGRDMDHLDSYCRIRGEPSVCVRQLADLFKLVNSNAVQQLDGLSRLCDALSAHVLASKKQVAVIFDAEFGRRLEYYSGFVFEVRVQPSATQPSTEKLGQIAGGGRYDHLLTELGADRPIGAVGGAIFVDRLLAAKREASAKREA